MNDGHDRSGPHPSRPGTAIVLFLALIATLPLASCGDHGRSDRPETGTSAWGQLRGDINNTGRSDTRMSDDGALEWALSLGNPVTSAITIGPFGNLRVKPTGPDLFSISPDGAILWKIEVGFGACAPIVDRFGSAFVGTDDGRVVGVDRNGALIFDLFLGPNLGSGFHWRDDAFFFAGTDGQIFAVTSDGELLATLAVGATGETVTATQNEDNQFFIASTDGSMYEVLIDFTELPSVRSSILLGGAVSRSSVAASNFSVFVVTDEDVLVRAFRRAFDDTEPGKVVWTYDPESQTTTGGASSPAIGRDNTIYYGTQDGRMLAISFEGLLKWTYDAESPVSSSPALDGDDGLVFRTRDGRIHFLDSEGQLRFVREIEDPSTFSTDSSPTIDSEGSVYVGTTSGFVLKMGSRPIFGQSGHNATHRSLVGPQGPNEGLLHWSVSIGAPLASEPLVFADGRTLLHGRDGVLRTVSDVGRVETLFSVGNKVRGLAIGPSGNIHITTDDGRLIVRGLGGNLIDEIRLGESALSRPTILADGSMRIASSGGDLYYLDSELNVTLEISTRAVDLSPPAVDFDGSTFIASSSGHLLGFDPDGNPLWEVAVPGPVSSSSPVIAPDGSVYVATSLDIVIAVSRSGSGMWTFDPPGDTHVGGLGGPAILADGTLVYATLSGVVFGIDPVTGRSIFEHTLGSRVLSPPRVDLQGTIYITTEGGNVHALDSLGQPVLEIPTTTLDGQSLMSPTTLIGDRRLMVVSEGSRASLIRDRASWSVFHGNQDHRGRHSIAGPQDPNALSIEAFDIGGTMELSPIVSPLGDVAVHTTEGELIVLTESGVTRFRDPVGTGPGLPVVLGQGLFVAGSQSGILSAFLEDGTPSWFLDFDSRVTGINVTDADTILAGSRDGLLRSVRPDGSIAWEVDVGPQGEGAPALGHDGLIRVATTDARLVILTERGDVVREIALPSAVNRGSPLVDAFGTTYILTDRCELVAIASDGRTLWTYDPGTGLNNGGRASPAITADDTIILGSVDGHVYGVRSSGTLRLDYDSSAPIQSAPAIDARGLVFVGNDAGELHALELDENGVDVVFVLDLADSPLTSPALANDGSLWIGSQDGILYRVFD